MEEQIICKPRRRKKTRMEIIKEAYLPYIFLLITAVFIIICIVGAIIQGAQEDPQEESGDTTPPQIAALITEYSL